MFLDFRNYQKVNKEGNSEAKTEYDPEEANIDQSSAGRKRAYSLSRREDLEWNFTKLEPTEWSKEKGIGFFLYKKKGETHG
jgi:hypothetical protein